MRNGSRTYQPFSKSGLGAIRLKVHLLFIRMVPGKFSWDIAGLFLNMPPTFTLEVTTTGT